jgi:hypothetical protein
MLVGILFNLSQHSLPSSIADVQALLSSQISGTQPYSPPLIVLPSYNGNGGELAHPPSISLSTHSPVTTTTSPPVSCPDQSLAPRMGSHCLCLQRSCSSRHPPPLLHPSALQGPPYQYSNVLEDLERQNWHLGVWMVGWSVGRSVSQSVGFRRKIATRKSQTSLE